MWASEYVAEVTRYINDPVTVGEVTRELLAHLEEIKAEAMAAGIDAEMAEAMALTRMGPAAQVARSLALTHHTHLPWRHYLAIIPLVGLFLLFQVSRTPMVVGGWLILLLIGSLVPGLAVWQRLYHRVRTDAQLKWHWLKEQELLKSAGVAAAAAVLTGLLFLLLVEPLRSSLVVGALFSLVPVAVAAALGRNRWGLQPFLVAGLHGVLMPLVFLPVLFNSGFHNWCEIIVALVAYYITAGSVIVWAMEWWRRRALSIKLVVERSTQ